MLFVPTGLKYNWVWSNVETLRPVVTATNFGDAVTVNLSTTTYGAWTNLATSAEVAYDVYGILICLNNYAASNAIRNALFNIGVDNAGGTSYRVVIPALIGGSSSPYYLGSGGIWYYFPLFIPAGSSIAVQAKGTAASTTAGCAIWLYGQPDQPELVKTGSIVAALGIDDANNRGTTITMGTTADGTWLNLGLNGVAPYAGKFDFSNVGPPWWVQCGFAQNDASMTAAAIHCDVALGTATQKVLILEDQLWTVTAAEQIASNCYFNGYTRFYNGISGNEVWVRAQSSSASDTGPCMAVYMMF